MQFAGWKVLALIAACTATPVPSLATRLSSPDCSADVQRIGSADYVRTAVRLLRIKLADIRFQQCDRKGFLTAASAYDNTFTVYYPALLDVARYKAPIVHELGHVLQLQQTGSQAALLTYLDGSSARVELGADFLAGVVYQKAWNRDADSFAYQSDSGLLGSFEFEDPNHHGTQVDRNNAFRLGRFIRDEKAHGDLWLDHRYYQQYLYSRFRSER